MTYKLTSDSMVAKAAIWIVIVVIGFLLSGALSDIVENRELSILNREETAVLEERIGTHIDASVQAMTKLQQTLDISQACLFKIQLNQPCN